MVDCVEGRARVLTYATNVSFTRGMLRAGVPVGSAMEKSRIVEALGEEGLRLPALLNEALAANDRAKYLFTVLQVAQGHAEHPGGPAAGIARRA